ncbi:serine ammonia-lyase [Bacillus sp. FSL R5-0677]|uniref:serine ammonia-lyase n=1 Tax=Bacillus sp. FSL R5-0677 TaxID=2921581 RepID=UPI0030F910EB
MADRLAVRIASGFVDRTLEPFLNGVYTASNNYLYKLLKELTDIERKDYMQKTL